MEAQIKDMPQNNSQKQQDKTLEKTQKIKKNE